MAEMLTYEQHLTSATGGRGSYHMEYSHYEEVPHQAQAKIIAAAKAHAAATTRWKKPAERSRVFSRAGLQTRPARLRGAGSSDPAAFLRSVIRRDAASRSRSAPSSSFDNRASTSG